MTCSPAGAPRRFDRVFSECSVLFCVSIGTLTLVCSDEVQASAASRLDEEKARHAIACASLEQVAAELESKRAQIEGEIIQQQSAHGQRMAVVSAPFDSLAASKAEIEQEQLQLQHALQDSESRARAAFESITLLRLKVEETVHHKMHLANQAAALVDSRAHMIQALDDLLARERGIDAEIVQVKMDSANRPLRLKVMQLKDDVVQAQNRLQVQLAYAMYIAMMTRDFRTKRAKSPLPGSASTNSGKTRRCPALVTTLIGSGMLHCCGSYRASRSAARRCTITCICSRSTTKCSNCERKRRSRFQCPSFSPTKSSSAGACRYLSRLHPASRVFAISLASPLPSDGFYGAVL